jgi:hypothetical protein
LPLQAKARSNALSPLELRKVTLMLHMNFSHLACLLMLQCLEQLELEETLVLIMATNTAMREKMKVLVECLLVPTHSQLLPQILTSV